MEQSKVESMKPNNDEPEPKKFKTTDPNNIESKVSKVSLESNIKSVESDDDLYYTPEDPNQPHILDDIPDLSTYQSFTERYFTKRYILNAKGIKNSNLMLMFHSNRITLLCLAPSHFFFKKTGKYKVNFSAGNVDRLKNTVKGKGKKGGQCLHPESVICKLEFEDGTSFNVPCGLKGTLIEVNENLLEEPELLREYPDADGYIAVILSSIANSDAAKGDLLTHEEYVKKVNSDNVDE